MSVAQTAALLHTTERALRAIMRVECGSDDPMRGVDAEGRPLIRVEAALVNRRTATSSTVFRTTGAKAWQGHELLFDGAWALYHPDERRKAGLPAGRPDEWDALDGAVGQIGAPAAICCASWGCGQVLGRPELGLSMSVAAYRASVLADGGLDLMRRYFEQVAPYALAALRNLDWHGFAAAYNGPGKAVEYGIKIADAYDKG